MTHRKQTTPSRSTLGRLVLGLVAGLGISGTAQAVTVYNVLGPGFDNGFGFSWIHSANYPMTFDGTTYYPGGSLLYRLSGSFRGNWIDATTFEFLPSTLTATGVGGLAGTGDWEFRILGGGLDTSPGRPVGEMMYALSHASGLMSSRGVFVIDPVHFVSIANSASPTDLAIWANNWHANPKYWEVIDNPPEMPLGIDLRAVAAPIPEPQAILAFVIGGLVIGRSAWRARGRRAA